MSDARKPLPTFAALQQRNVEEQATASAADPIEAPTPAPAAAVTKEASALQPHNIVMLQHYNVTNRPTSPVEGVARVEELSRYGEMAAHLNVRLTQDADDMIEEALYALRHVRAKKQAVISAALELGLRAILKETGPTPEKEA